MVSDGVPWLGAVAWTLLAAQASRVGWTARPNMYTFVGLALTVVICERFHRGAISRRQTLWLIPLFFLWANMHSGFLAGALVLAVTYLVELSLSCCAPEQAVREAARSRLRWLTGLGLILFVVTLVNPYGLGLYMWTISALARSVHTTVVDDGVATTRFHGPRLVVCGIGHSVVSAISGNQSPQGTRPLASAVDHLAAFRADGGALRCPVDHRGRTHVGVVEL